MAGIFLALRALKKCWARIERQWVLGRGNVYGRAVRFSQVRLAKGETIEEVLACGIDLVTASEVTGAAIDGRQRTNGYVVIVGKD
ncbi:hypothetical protein BC567DRAFT_237764 [Phyllosticta citribraziliensis]